MARIELVDVAHAYEPGVYAVKDINLTWEDGVTSALLGPSGCGKTTLLKIISGLLIPSQGQVLIDGQDVTHLSPRDRNIAQVFQFPVVYETLSVYDNLAFPLRNLGVEKSQIKGRVQEIAEILNLEDVLKQKASQLGADFKQRVSMGRGIVRTETAGVLLDEPLTVIDHHQKWHLRRKLKQLHQRTNFTMIYVTHDQHEALTFAEQVTVMDVGKALQTGSPQELHEWPQTPFVGYFIGSPGMNIFPAKIHNQGIEIGDYVIKMIHSPSVMNGTRLEAGIRPEYVNVSRSRQQQSLACTVIAVTRTGQAQILDLQSGETTFKARVDGQNGYSVGNPLWVTFPHNRLMLYADGQLVSRINDKEKVQ